MAFSTEQTCRNAKVYNGLQSPLPEAAGVFHRLLAVEKSAAGGRGLHGLDPLDAIHLDDPRHSGGPRQRNLFRRNDGMKMDGHPRTSSLCWERFKGPPRSPTWLREKTLSERKSGARDKVIGTLFIQMSPSGKAERRRR